MDEILYNIICNYYLALKKLGSYNYDTVLSILLLCFYRDFVFEDYDALLSRKDYHTIEKALNCLFGKDCLIPYPDYLKMGKLHLGSMTEMAQRLRDIENEAVLKLMPDGTETDCDIEVTTEEVDNQ